MLKLKNDIIQYPDQMYETRDEGSRYSADNILDIVFDVFPEINSVIDIGCGVGTWLKAAKDKGVKDILGIDGKWVKKKYLSIDKKYFLDLNLEDKITINKKYDLAITLELAEHLSPKRAKSFVRDLIKLSDIVLFSAAIPFQQGLNHINEQWPNYWANFFNQNDYVCLDIIRPNVWDNKKISFWYKQNTFLYINKNKLKSLNNKNIKTQYPDSACLVHPELFLNNRPIPLKGAIKLLFISILNSIKSRFFKI